MAKATVPQPNLRTPDDQLSSVELAKLHSNGIRGTLAADFRDGSVEQLMDQAEQVAKSHGIYLEYNRAKTGREKDWMYMVRMSVPGGGPLTGPMWTILDDLASRYTAGPGIGPSLRLTTRQNIQFHWIRKADVIDLVRQVARTGFYTLNGCGDNTRNVMGCPLSRHSTLFDANALARRLGGYFRLQAEPHIEIFGIDPSHIRTPEERFHYGPKLLNRKFKIAVSAIHRDERTGEWAPDNCVELRTNDLGISPILGDGRVEAFQVYLGGGQGEKNGKATFSGQAVPFGIFAEADLLGGVDAIVRVHQEWGDRQNRHWARVKYVVQKMGIEWFREQARQRGAVFGPPDPDHDVGDRRLHHGWHRQPDNGLWTFGAYIENGRITDGANGQLKKMVRHVMDRHDLELLTTPNQDLLFTNISDELKGTFEDELRRFGYGQRNGREYSTLRLNSGACVGLHTCRLSYTESEQFEPELIDELENRGYGEVAESIGITGCERQCFRPATKSIGWIGAGPNLYQIKLGGTEDGRHQGIALVGADESGRQRMFLRQVPRDRVADVCQALFDYHAANRTSAAESLGLFLRRVGLQAIIEHLKAHPQVGPLLEKTHAPPYIPPEQLFAGSGRTAEAQAPCPSSGRKSLAERTQAAAG